MRQRSGAKSIMPKGKQFGAGGADALPSSIGRAYAAIAALDPRFKICYLIPHLEQSDATTSIFGWYTEGLQQAAGPLRVAATLPADIREPYADTGSVLAQRLLRHVWPMIVPIEVEAIEAVLGEFLHTPFRVFLTNNALVADEVDRRMLGASIPHLHVSSVPGVGRTSSESLDAGAVCRFVRAVLDSLAGDPTWAGFVRQARQVMSQNKQRLPKKHSLPAGLHNVTLPNEAALIAFGWKLTKTRRISMPLFVGSGDPQRYVDCICESADAVSREREELLGEFWPYLDYRLILAVSSVHWGHYDRWRAVIQQASPSARNRLKRMYAAVVQAKSYFDLIEVDGEGEAIAKEVHSEIAKARSADMAAFTSALAALSSATLAPVLRLEPKLNEVRGDIKLLASCVRSEGHSNFVWKTSRLTRRLGEKMRALVNDAFLSRIDAPEREGRIEGMKLVSDVPLELMLSKGLPLCLRFDVSRLPPIPGNLFLGQCLTPPIIIPLCDFSEVLVIRSFAATDVLRSMFEDAVNIIQSGPRDVENRINYRFVDVQTRDEFIAALQSYDGAVLVFDGHGTYNKETGTGSLVVGGSALDLWSMRKLCRIPPIVMFSACDTQPIDGSHSSVANAVFNLGARAVLATMFPIYGTKAAMFNARMLFRLEAFIPAALSIQPFVTWREVASGMLRMSYAYEVLRALADFARVPLSESQIQAIQLRANNTINARKASWHEVLVADIAEATMLPVKDVERKIAQWAGLTDSLKYLQLGSPENIIIVREHPATVLQQLPNV